VSSVFWTPDSGARPGPLGRRGLRPRSSTSAPSAGSTSATSPPAPAGSSCPMPWLGSTATPDANRPGSGSSPPPGSTATASNRAAAPPPPPRDGATAGGEESRPRRGDRQAREPPYAAPLVCHPPAEDGHDIRTVQELLAHRDVSTTVSQWILDGARARYRGAPGRLERLAPARR
jgi:hypothetical protein